jgi:hypothetical protein
MTEGKKYSEDMSEEEYCREFFQHANDASIQIENALSA